MVLLLFITKISTANFIAKTSTTNFNVKDLFIYFPYRLADRSKSQLHKGKDVSLGLVTTSLTLYNRGTSCFIQFIFVRFH
jgi:hypothetical protein